MDLSLIHEQAYRNVLLALEHGLRNHLLANPALAPGGTATNFQLGLFSYMLDGQPRSKAAANNIAAPGASTEAGQYRKVLVCVDAAGVVSTVAGEVAASQEAAPLPDAPAGTLAVGVLELSPEFTSGTTAITSGMCKPVALTVNVAR